MEIQGKQFQVKSNLTAKKYIARLAGQLRKITHFYTKDVDFGLIEGYRARFAELNTIKSQIETVLKEGKDSKGELNDEQKKEYGANLEKVTLQIEAVSCEYDNDVEAQSQADLKTELEGLALIEFASDEKFLKPALREILDGDIDAIDFTETAVAGFLANMIRDFFLKMK